MNRQMQATLLTSLLVLGVGVAWAGEGASYINGADVTLASQPMGSATAGRDIVLNDVTVNGKLTAGRNVMCTQCQISGNISAGHDVQLENCPTVQGVTSGHDVLLTDVKLAQGLRVGNTVAARNSEIQGPLVLGGHNVRLENTRAGEIRFSNGIQGGVNGSSVIVNSGTVMHSSMGGGNVIVGNGWGGSSVSVGANGLSSVNGYTIKSVPGQTTVITPEQTIYVNGKKVSGEGGKNYSDFMAMHPGAPQVNGPGWDYSANLMSGATTSQSTVGPVVNVLEVASNSTVIGPIVFESGQGVVRVPKGAQFNAKIVNGKVERY
jgi:hypothetical protein